MKTDTIWNIILIASIILIINGISDIGDPDKKTANAAQDEAVMGSIGVVAFVVKKQMAQAAGLMGATALGPIGWIVAIGASLFMIPGIWSGVRDMFSPSKLAIPGWVWIGAFFVLVLMIIGRKRN